MSKIKYDDFIDEEFINTCFHCGSQDFYMDWEDDLYRCNNCGEAAKESTNNNHVRREKPKVRKFKENRDAE